MKSRTETSWADTWVIATSAASDRGPASQRHAGSTGASPPPQSGSSDPFYDVGRTFGSNARGVRTTYLTLELLRLARLLERIDTAYVERTRYSVWGILGTNSRFRAYIGLDNNARSYLDVQNALEDVDLDRVGEIVSDLTPDGSRPSLLSDSRQVSKYAEVLTNERSRGVLRTYGDMTLATLVLEQGALTQRLQSQARALREILVDAGRVAVDEEAPAAAEEVAELARSIRAVVIERVRHHD